MLKKTLALSLLLSAFVTSSLSFADSTSTTPSKKSSCACSKNMKKKAAAIQLTDAQIAQIKTIKANAKETNLNNKQKLKAIKSQLKNLAAADKVDQQALDNLSTQKASIQTEMTKSRVMAKNAMFNVLTAEQKTQFKNMDLKWSKLCTMHSHCKCAA